MTKLGTFLIWLFTVALEHESTKAWAAELISSWAKSKGLRYDVALEMQPVLAKAMDLRVCEYCQWAVESESDHEYCESELAIREYEDDAYDGSWFTANRVDDVNQAWDEAVEADRLFDEEEDRRRWNAEAMEQAAQAEEAYDAYLEEQAAKHKADEDAAWEWLYQQKEQDSLEEYLNEVCPCGHKHNDHYSDEGYCEIQHCDCPQFGEPAENYETYTITNLGDGPGGFHTCE